MLKLSNLLSRKKLRVHTRIYCTDQTKILCLKNKKTYNYLNQMDRIWFKYFWLKCFLWKTMIEKNSYLLKTKFINIELALKRQSHFFNLVLTRLFFNKEFFRKFYWNHFYHSIVTKAFANLTFLNTITIFRHSNTV